MDQFACALCSTTIPGETRSEAVEDAMNIGWESRQGMWICADCIIEEEKL